MSLVTPPDALPTGGMRKSKSVGRKQARMSRRSKEAQRKRELFAEMARKMHRSLHDSSFGLFFRDLILKWVGGRAAGAKHFQFVFEKMGNNEILGPPPALP